MRINEVYKVKETAEVGVYTIECNVTIDSETFDAIHSYRPEDNIGLSPEIRQWLEDNPNFPKTAYVPLTLEETRKGMPNLTARQFRLGMLAGGILSTDIVAVIEGMPDGVAKESAKIEWEYATTFSRLHPLVVQLSTSLGFTPEAVDELWENARNV